MRWISILILSLLISSCGPQPVYEEEREINSAGWSSEDPLEFNTSISDTTATYELQLIVEHTPQYKYENIYLQIGTYFPEQDPKTEQLSIDLATKKGEWVGKCSGKSCKCKVYLLDNFKFPSQGDYRFKVNQFTRDELLSGILGMKMALYETE